MMHARHTTCIRSIKPYYCYQLCTTKVEQPQPWLNFTMLVKDRTGTTNFAFIGKQAEQLLGSSAQQLLTEQSSSKKQVLPQEFQELRTKKYTFTVHWAKANLDQALSVTSSEEQQKLAPTTEKKNCKERTIHKRTFEKT